MNVVSHEFILKVIDQIERNAALLGVVQRKAMSISLHPMTVSTMASMLLNKYDCKMPNMTEILYALPLAKK